jgi:cell growth-regulating nucleolar protein
LFNLSRADEFKKHTSCVTEAERYEKSIYRGPKKADEISGGGNKKKKKMSPQESWMSLIHSSVDDAPSDLKPWLEQIVNLGDNVPRKEKQFGNLVANSLRIHNKSTVEKIWKYLQSIREEQRAQQEKAKEAQEEKKSKEDTKVKTGATSESDGNADQEVKENEGNSAMTPPETETVLENASPCQVESDEESKQDNNSLPDVEKISKEVKKALKKAPKKRMEYKSLRKEVETRLAIKKACSKDLKRLLKRNIESGLIKKVTMDGDIVVLS